MILGCLAHRREDRIQSVKEVAQRLARAIPNGEALLAFVASRLIDAKLAPTAITINDAIGPAATAWATHWSSSGSQQNVHLRVARVAHTLALLGVGASLGGGAVGFVMSVAGGDGPGAPAELVAVAPPPDQPAAAPPDAAQLAVVADAAAPRDAAPAIDAAVASDAAATAMAIGGAGATPAPPPRPPVPPPAPPPGSGSAGPRVSKPTRVTAAPASPGSLRVLVEPWADVTIIGRCEAFTTPGTIPLPAGSYRVVLTKGTRKETIDVQIKPNELTLIQRTW